MKEIEGLRHEIVDEEKKIMTRYFPGRVISRYSEISVVHFLVS